MDETTLYDSIDLTVGLYWSDSAWGKTAATYAWSLYEFMSADMDTPLHAVTTMVLDEWIADDTGGTANRKLSAISKVFTTARQRGYMGPVPYFPRQKEPQHRERYLTEVEVEELRQRIGAEDPDAADIVTLLVDTGMRLGEAYALRPADINWTTGMLMVRKSKSGKARSIPMTAAVREILDSPTPKVPLSPPQTTFRKLWDKARAAMGEADSPDFVPHILRHTCASRLVQGGVPLMVVQEWLGHAHITMTQRYAHLSPDNLAAAAQVLEGR